MKSSTVYPTTTTTAAAITALLRCTVPADKTAAILTHGQASSSNYVKKYQNKKA